MEEGSRRFHSIIQALLKLPVHAVKSCVGLWLKAQAGFPLSLKGAAHLQCSKLRSLLVVPLDIQV